MTDAFVFFGRKSKAGIVPMTKDTMYLFLTSEEGPEGSHIPEDEVVAQFKGFLQDYPVDKIQNLLDAIQDPNAIIYRPLSVYLHDQPWHQGRVVLLGDAVHATTPHLGQGAALAMEDGLVLAEELAKLQGDNESPLDVHASVAHALCAFTDRRFARAKMTVDASKRLGELEMAQWHGEAIDPSEVPRLTQTTTAKLFGPI